MKNITLFLEESNPEVLREQLKAAFSDCILDFNGIKSAWDRVAITKKTGWFSKKTMTIFPRTLSYEADSFVQTLSGMLNFVGQIPARNAKVKAQLMVKIQQTQAGLGCVSESFESFEEEIFAFLTQQNAYAFIDGTMWQNGNAEIILDTSGFSQVQNLDVPDEAIRLGQAEADQATEPTEQQITRRQRNIALLKSQNVPTIEHLPCVEDEVNTKLRTHDATVQRTLAVAFCAIKAEGIEDAIIKQVVKQYEAEAFFTPDEQRFMQTAEPSEQDRVKFTWRYEGLAVLLWALGHTEKLNFPTEICDVAGAVTIIREAGSYANFSKLSKLRSASEILDAADYIYRLNWACVNARIKQQAAPAGVETGVVFERHYALNWLINYQNADWDNVRTDT